MRFELTQTKLPKPGARHHSIAVGAAEMTFLDFQPFSIVNDVGFKRFVHLLDPAAILPSRPHVTEKILPSLYRELCKKVKSSISGQSIALSTDSWTSRASESYTTFTAHMIDSNWKQQVYVLATMQSTDHSSDAIAELVKLVSLQWGIEPQAITTDNASKFVNYNFILLHFSASIITEHAFSWSFDIIRNQ